MRVLLRVECNGMTEEKQVDVPLPCIWDGPPLCADCEQILDREARDFLIEHFKLGYGWAEVKG